MVTTGESTCQNKNRFVLMWSRLVYGGWDTSVCSGSSSNVFHLIWSSHESHFRSGTNFCLVSGNSSGVAILAGAWWHEGVWFVWSNIRLVSGNSLSWGTYESSYDMTRWVSAQDQSRATTMSTMSSLTAWEHEQIWSCIKTLEMRSKTKLGD